MPISDCKLIQLPRIEDSRGALTFIEGGHHVPFSIQRVYYLYDVPQQMERGGHAHKELQQLMIAMSGAFDIELDDGSSRKTVHLDSPDVGLLITRMNWRELLNFSPGAVCVVLASLPYDESDYYRDYEEFRSAVKTQGESA